MADPVTYGGLVDDAVRIAARATARGTTRPVELDTTGLVGLVRVAGRHASLLSRRFGVSHPAWSLADVVGRTVAALPSSDTPRPGVEGASPWHVAAGRLALAHDLLAQQVGPDGQELGPDARHLADRDATVAATGRVATLTALAADAAQDLFTELRTAAPPDSAERRPVVSGSQLPPNARALWLIRGLAVPAGDIVDQCGGPDRPGPLDDLQPLFADRDLPVLDRRLEQLRLAAFVLSQPDASPTHHALAALADLAAVIAGQTNLALRPYSNPGRRTASPHDQASKQAVATAAAWEIIPRMLAHTVSLGTEGRVALALAEDIRQRLTGALAGDTPQGLAPFRRAALVLPDLALSGAVTARRLLGGDLLTYRASHDIHIRLDRRRAARLTQAYTDALAASHALVARLAELPGTQPRPHLAAHLGSQTPRPPTTSQAHQPADIRPPRLTTPAGEPRWVEINDREHGTLHCLSDDLVRALRHPTDDLRQILAPLAHQLGLSGREPHITLAVLAIHHLADKIAPAAEFAPDPSAGTAPPPTIGFDL
ncbi:hypothetical protein I6A84_27060 [Frankia sp. CNm7]|uniref:Uncharacterized protein n=1 Tax=Frankia nepalensis TaxID=1836974 RepID=A0A937RJN6_9ACTN|nr:hypothetical protein [Frankia nepalensis]MBL7496327.1 hypothetical protein [Frankia nepalensis]MBL7508476.1 hypothetical protein [Frankia nepalensis]MBL7521640.1 hypothetical protein [Frankia nepalensis]MBL7627608.1 hypothetical protein [Frankia nepalensis]